MMDSVNTPTSSANKLASERLQRDVGNLCVAAISAGHTAAASVRPAKLDHLPATAPEFSKLFCAADPIRDI
jgi:hypothetical protein